VFSQFNGAPSTAPLLAEAGVTSATAATSQSIFVDETPPFQTALAYANPSTADANVTFDLLNAEGQSILNTSRVLSSGTHDSLFVYQLFQDLPAGHVGSLRISSDVPITLVSLRFAGQLFTSVPPFPLQ
jgi:hypothetical protein